MAYKLILASASPRRQQLMREAGFTFEVRIKEVPEIYPDDLPVNQVPEYLARLKASAFQHELQPDELLITADTIVSIHNKAVGKPGNRQAAIEMLRELSGNRHTVVSGLCLTTSHIQKTTSVCTDVFFRELTEEEIIYYVDKYRPLDKAGAYGIQEWIGYVGIERIDGSFYNVMGLPIQTLYRQLQEFGVDLCK
ncbi:Maf family nucleotide pyrophosphatase [Odoribacter lunatus]|uniref:Maf family nucleotide pyrophosphatase n=1 Tax=Odoribacter lunatus TaxID=2941335 RepID=UPI00203FCDFF|nr:Maf family nucleotide pyrophosphatase [Odoribacter lunatus]